jgi:hypothetical protein
MEGTIAHSTTTFRRIVALYDEERCLLDQAGDANLTADEQRRFAKIRAALTSLWPKKRTRAGD